MASESCLQRLLGSERIARKKPGGGQEKAKRSACAGSATSRIPTCATREFVPEQTASARSQIGGTVKTMKGMRSGVSMMVFPPEKLCLAATTEAGADE